MKENVELVLTLLTQGFTIDEIENTLNINHQELNQILKTIKNLGYNYTKSFHSDGTIHIKASRTLNLNPKEHVKVNVKNSTFRTLIISDPHIGGPYEKPKRLRAVSKYAVDHDIHTIFNTGDLINNYYPGQEPEIKITDPIQQAKRYIRYTPYVSKLIYFNLGGNHDFKSVIETGFDPLRYISENRFEQISLGYGLCFVHLKGDTIALVHELKDTIKNVESTLVFKGHSHKFRNRDSKMIYVPAITDNYQGPYEYVPLSGFLDAEFYFFADKITKVNLKGIAFINDDLRLGAEETIVLRPDLEERYIRKLKKTKK